MTSDPSASARRKDFKVIRPIPTRWMDNDHYGHVNNVAYYSFFDTAVNGFLIDACGTDIRELPAIGIVAESSCTFLCTIWFPVTLTVPFLITAFKRLSPFKTPFLT